jgi:hypothetical protein
MEPLLDGKAPASAIAATVTRAPEGVPWRARELCPERPREGHDAVLVEPRSATLPRPACRPRCSRPWAGLATLPLTSSVAILGGPGLSLAGGPRPHRLEPPYPASPQPRQRPRPFAGPGRLPSTSAPSPCRASRFRVRRVGSRGARHRCRCSRARGFRHRDPASGAASLPVPPRTGAGELDP